MKNLNFPSSRMILPEFRREVTKKQSHAVSPAYDEQFLLGFQSLLEQSYQFGQVVRIVSASDSGTFVTTGIVRKVSPASGTIEVETLEGPRILSARRISSVTEF